MKIIIFGTGLFYKNRKDKISDNIEIIAFCDNNMKLWGKFIDGVEIVNPNLVLNFNFDKIVLMSKSAVEMRQQLLGLKVDSDKIIDWNTFLKILQRGKFQFFCGSEQHSLKGRILILSTPLGYTGAPLTAVYAAMALQLKDYDVMICASEGNKKFINEIVEYGINVILCPAIPFWGKEELFWIRQFDLILVNTFLLLPCVCDISLLKPAIWWIHECSARFERYYPDTLQEFRKHADEIKNLQLNIFGVSSIANKNFNMYYKNKMCGILPYGIPDKRNFWKGGSVKIQKKIFAVIGTICERKGQKIFLDAVNMLNDQERDSAEFWIIGADADKEYFNYVRKRADQHECVKIKGELSRKEIENAYRQINVVVCPSLEETMSIVLTEGMMYGKVCITTNNTGMANYFVNRENGLVCETGDAVSLCNCMKWIIDNWKVYNKIGKKARETYEKYFTLEQFAERLEKIIAQTKRKNI